MQSIADQLTDEQVGRGHDACEVGYPWITREAIRFLDSIVQPDFKVLECGAGGSTVYFTRKGCNVCSIESNYEWSKRVVKCLEGYNPLLCQAPTHEAFVDMLNSLSDDAFDLVSIDSDPACTDRLGLLQVALPKLKKEGWLMLDNYGTFGVEKFVPPSAWEVHKFDQTGWAGSGTAILRKR